MIKELMHDPIFLVRKCTLATKEDLLAAKDLIDIPITTVLVILFLML